MFVTFTLTGSPEDPNSNAADPDAGEAYKCGPLDPKHGDPPQYLEGRRQRILTLMCVLQVMAVDVEQEEIFGELTIAKGPKFETAADSL